MNMLLSPVFSFAFPVIAVGAAAFLWLRESAMAQAQVSKSTLLDLSSSTQGTLNSIDTSHGGFTRPVYEGTQDTIHVTPDLLSQELHSFLVRRSHEIAADAVDGDPHILLGANNSLSWTRTLE